MIINLDGSQVSFLYLFFCRTWINRIAKRCADWGCPR